jgi:hypothetical protein
VSTLAVVIMVLVVVLGVPFTLWWWKIADRWASDEHKRFKPKPGGAAGASTRETAHGPAGSSAASSGAAQGGAKGGTAGAARNGVGHAGNPFARGARNDRASQTERVVIEGFDSDGRAAEGGTRTSL